MDLKNNDKAELSDYIIGGILAFIAAVIPLIVRMALVEVSSAELNLLRSAPYVTDLFSYYKSVAVIIMAVIILIFLGLELMTDFSINTKFFKSVPVICIGVYALMVILSALFSGNKSVAFSGISERYEGMWVLLSYVVVFLTAMAYSERKAVLKCVIIGFMLSAFFVGIIGFTQFIGKDFLVSDFGKKIILGKYFDEVSNLKTAFSDVYSTLYNPNCVGMYTAMMLPFFTVLAFTAPLKSAFKYISVFLAVLMAVNLIGSDSSGGIVGAATAFLIVILVCIAYFIYNRKYKKISKSIISAFVILIAAIIGTAVFSPAIKDKFVSVVNAVLNPVANDSSYYYKDVIVDENKAVIKTANGNITIEYSDNDFNLIDEHGNKIDYVSTEVINNENQSATLYKYSLDNIGDYYIEKNGNYVSISNGEESSNQNINFMFMSKDGIMYPLDKNGKEIDLSIEIPKLGFEGKELFANSRGYIWSRTLPMIKHSIIIGKGPDTFALEFPQNDFVGKTKFFGDPYIIVDKPHNLFLQTAVNTGLISLISLTVLFVLYIIQSVKSILFIKCDLYTTGIKIALLGAVLGYLFTSLSTDGVVSVAPVFWIILGTGFAVNKLK